MWRNRLWRHKCFHLKVLIRKIFFYYFCVFEDVPDRNLRPYGTLRHITVSTDTAPHHCVHWHCAKSLCPLTLRHITVSTDTAPHHCVSTDTVPHHCVSIDTVPHHCVSTDTVPHHCVSTDTVPHQYAVTVCQWKSAMFQTNKVLGKHSTNCGDILLRLKLAVLFVALICD
jgi:hypothetical protein